MPETLQIQSLPDLSAAIAATAELLTATILEQLKLEKPVLLLLAGGSAIKVYAQAAEILKTKNLAKDFFTHKLTIAVEDERWPIKNNAQDILASNFIQTCQASGAAYQAMPTNPDLQQAAIEYNTWLENFISQTSPFVLVAIGMGADGHILGINVDEDGDHFTELFESAAYVTGYHSQAQTANFPEFPDRVTLTLTGVRTASLVVGLVAGSDKQAMLKKLLSSNAPVNFSPNQVLKELAAHIFTDQVINPS